ncbi:hypothetical protein F5Y16DRAFT_396825 [Xylariaceae sp. FL0255]|nr:hypothetical protein F5Y16DRAFT_396825 [Xylariaceae sp. FL0255]
MELTPIKIRGKRRAKGDPTHPPRLKHQKLETQELPQKKPRRLKPSKMERKLPLEILESIFLMSENVNLPRASPLIGRLLSAPTTLRKTFLLAFAPTWEVWFGQLNLHPDPLNPVFFRKRRDGTWSCIRDEKLFESHKYIGEYHFCRLDGDPQFQSSLLECPWTTIDMILDCWDIFFRKHTAQKNREFHYEPLWDDLFLPPPRKDDSSKISHASEARHYFYSDFESWKRYYGSSYKGKGWEKRTRRPIGKGTWVEVHADTRIPDSLLSGPWDDRRLQKLFWMMRAGARLTEDQWEATREGWRQATADVNNPNHYVVSIFDQLGAFDAWPEHVKEAEHQRLLEADGPTSTLHHLETMIELCHTVGGESAQSGISKLAKEVAKRRE